MSFDSDRNAGSRVYVAGEQDYGTVVSQDDASVYVRMDGDGETVAAACEQVAWITDADNAHKWPAMAPIVAPDVASTDTFANYITAVASYAREWASDCEWGDVDGEELGEMSDAAVVKCAARHYAGGLRQLAADALGADAYADRTNETVDALRKQRRESL